MKVKASLHLHTKEDFRDYKQIRYTIFELIDLALKQDFRVLAVTGHEKLIVRAEHVADAKKKGLLLIPGVELNINRQHILVLNCDFDAEAIKSFSDLESYRQTHPQCFVIVPHPNYRLKSLGLEKLKKYRHLFDAVEHSWFYSKSFDLNQPVKSLTKQLGLPFVATSDLHATQYLNTDYIILEIEKLAIPNVFEAIRQGKFVNVSQPKKLTELFLFLIKLVIGLKV